MLGWMVWLAFGLCCLMLLMLMLVLVVLVVPVLLVVALTFGCGMILTTRDAASECFAVAAA